MFGKYCHAPCVMGWLWERYMANLSVKIVSGSFTSSPSSLFKKSFWKLNMNPVHQIMYKSTKFTKAWFFSLSMKLMGSIRGARRLG